MQHAIANYNTGNHIITIPTLTILIVPPNMIEMECACAQAVKKARAVVGEDHARTLIKSIHDLCRLSFKQNAATPNIRRLELLAIDHSVMPTNLSSRALLRELLMPAMVRCLAICISRG